MCNGQMKIKGFIEDEDSYDKRLEIDLYQMSEAADILPNYEDEIDLLQNYDEYF